MSSISEARAICRAWLATWWRTRHRARELLRQYDALKTECPAVLADLSRFCLAHDSTFVQDDPELSQINVGKREAWLHIQEMLGLDAGDLAHLKEETERDA